MNRIHNRGVTLLELLITVAIIAVLARIAIPSFVTYLQTSRLIGASQRLYYTLQYARSEAIKRNQTVYVSFQAGSSWCYGVNAGSSCSCNVANSCGLGTVSAPNAGQLTLSTTGLTSNSVRFDPNHGAAYASSTITLTTPGSLAMTVKVSLLGSLLLCSANVTGYPSCS